MIKERECKIMIATGKKGVGKTYTTLKLISKYVRNDLRTQRLGRKVLIFDVNGEYVDFPTLALKDLRAFTMQERAEVRRILAVSPKTNKPAGLDEMYAILLEILSTYRGGLLVLEDINKYLIGTATKEVISTIVTNRHNDMDIVIHLQNLRAMSPRLWANCNIVRFHKQVGRVAAFKDRVNNAELFFIAEQLVEDKVMAGDERFFCYVDQETDKISGNFDVSDIDAAVGKYLDQNPKLIKEMLNSIHDGPKSSRHVTAKAKAIQKYRHYYGNPLSESPQPNEKK